MQGIEDVARMNLSSLLYLSRSLMLRGDADQNVDDIVTTSRKWNPQRGLTGALLFTGEHFAQVLEGTDASIDGLMARVTTDARHDQIIVVAREQIVTRRFGEWSMAYSGPSQFVARHVTQLLNGPTVPDQNRSAAWLNDLMWEFAEGPGAT